MGLVRQGSSEALDQITRCYSERLLEAGRRHCRTMAEAQDAVQDALLSASTELASLRSDAALESWLIRVVASACRRIGRGRRNDPTLHDSELELATPSDPEQEAARRELAELLEALLLRLSPQDRSILVLSQLEDFSAAEIGAELGLSAGAVRTRLSRLRDHLVAELSQGTAKEDL